MYWLIFSVELFIWKVKFGGRFHVFSFFSLLIVLFLLQNDQDQYFSIERTSRPTTHPKKLGLLNIKKKNLFSNFFLRPQVFKKINHVSFIPSNVFYFYFFNNKTSPFILCFVSLLVIYTSPQLGSQIYIGINLVF